MKATIIIPTYNKSYRLKIMLATLYQQIDEKEGHEVIVIDDGSDLESKREIDKLQRMYKFRCFSIGNKGRAYARNVGIEKSENELLIFIDDDVILAPDFLQQHIMNQRQRPAVLHGSIRNFVYSYIFDDPIQGKILPTIDLSNHSSEYVNYLIERCKVIRDGSYDEILQRSKFGKLERKIIDVYKTGMQKWEWIGFTGGNVSCPKSWIQETGGFDNSFGLRWGIEDLELGYRLKVLGKQFGYCELASCCHMDHYREHSKEQHSESMKIFFEKHHDMIIKDLHDYLFD